MKDVMRVMCGLAIGAVLLAGCDRQDDTKSPVPAPPPPDVTPQAGGTVGGGADATGGGATGGGAVAGSAAPDQAPPSATQPATAPADPSAQQSRRGQELVARAMQAMKDNRIADARAAIEQAEAMRAELPQATREQLKTLRANLDSVERLQNASANQPTPADDDDVNK